MADYSQLLSGLFNAGVSAYNANQAAGAATAAGQQAAQAASFRPVGITTRFGRTGFQYDPSTGRLIGAGYQVAPDVAAMREGLLGLAGQGLQQGYGAAAYQPAINQAAEGLFNLGQGYLAQTPQQAAQQYMAQQQELLAPSDERAFAQLQNKLFRTGTGGLAVGATGARPSGAPGLAAANPQVEAFYNAMAQRNAGLAAQAQQMGMRQAEFGQGLLGGGINLAGKGFGLQQQALSPFETAFGLAGRVEQMGGFDPLKQSIALGGGNPAAAEALFKTGMSNVDLMEARNAQFAKALNDPVSQLLRSLTSPSSVSLPNTPVYTNMYGTNFEVNPGGVYGPSGFGSSF